MSELPVQQILGTTNIQMQVKNPTELYNKLCYKCYYRHA